MTLSLKLKLDPTDGGLVGKLANLRGMVQSPRSVKRKV